MISDADTPWSDWVGAAVVLAAAEDDEPLGAVVAAVVLAAAEVEVLELFFELPHPAATIMTAAVTANSRLNFRILPMYPPLVSH